TGGDGRDIADHPHEPRHQEGHDAEAEEDKRGGDGGSAILLHARPPEAWLPLHFSAVRPCLNLIATHSFPEDLEPLHLLAIAIEIFRREPEFQGAANRRPFVVENGIPGRVEVFPLHHHMLAKDPFEAKAEPQRSALRRLIAIVTLPLETAVSEIVEDMPGKQEEGFGCKTRARYLRAPINAAYLGHAVSGVNPHQGLPSSNLAGDRVVDDEEQGIAAFGRFLEPRLESLPVLRRIIAQPAEALFRIRYGGNRKEAVTMGSRIERFQPHVAPAERAPGRQGAGSPVLQVFHGGLLN